MYNFDSPAILLRRIDHGDSDLIITFFTLEKGKITAIAKSAKKSVKRFSGVLELFSVLQAVFTKRNKGGLFILKEATLEHPFSEIRSDIKKTAYASYWAELINQWVEAGQQQTQLYHLFYHVLETLDTGLVLPEELSIMFQMRFLAFSGLSPNLSQCSICRIETEKMKHNRLLFDLAKGGLVCETCSRNTGRQIFLSKGTIKQLQWIGDSDLKKALRIKFTSFALKEGLDFLETFVPFHLGKEPRSLKFLREIRRYD